MSKKRQNPIDRDKVTEIPHLLPFAHTIGSAIIRPVDKGRVKGVAMEAMYEQTDSQLHQIKEQVEHLLSQAHQIHQRIDISEKVYLADCGFQPVMGQEYHLYEKTDGTWVLSMVGREEWGDNPPFYFLATTKLLYDHTWEIIEINEEKPIFDL